VKNPLESGLPYKIAYNVFQFPSHFMIWIIACYLINLDNASFSTKMINYQKLYYFVIGWNIFRYRSFNSKAREYKKGHFFSHSIQHHRYRYCM